MSVVYTISMSGRRFTEADVMMTSAESIYEYAQFSSEEDQDDHQQLAKTSSK